MGRPLAIGDEAVARVAMTNLCEQIAEDDRTFGDAAAFGAAIVAAAQTVQFQPTSRRLVLTFDLSGPSEPDPAPANAPRPGVSD
jgi:hypothetical protein